MPPSVRAKLTNVGMRATTLAYVALDGAGRKDLLQRMIFANFSAQTPIQTGTPLDYLVNTWRSEKSAKGATRAMSKDMERHQTVMLDFFAAANLRYTSELSPQTAADFLAWRSTVTYRRQNADEDCDASKEKTPVQVSASSLRHELQALRQIAKVAHRNGWLDNGRLWDDVQVRSIAGQNTKIVEPLTPMEQRAVLAELCVKGREHMHDAVLLLLVTGMRVGEIDVLRPGCIVSGTLQLHGQSVGMLKPATGKTAAAERILPICPTLQALFDRGYILDYKADRLKRNMGRGWFLAKFPTVHAHALRHSFAVNKLLSGTADLQMVKYQLGHADISTTANLYGKFSPDQFKAGFEQIKKERAELLEWLEQGYFQR